MRWQADLRRMLLLALALALVPVAAAPAATRTTGRLLVTLAPQAGVRAASALTLDGVRRDGSQAPQINLVSVRPVGGRALSAVASALRRRAGVAHVEVEHRHELRLIPNDPSLTTLETAPGTPPGTPLQWWVARSGLPAAWDIERGADARVAVIDTGVDSGQPDIAARSPKASTTTPRPARGRRRATRTATARTSRRWRARPATTRRASSERAWTAA
jgi:hypothetical protein